MYNNVAVIDQAEKCQEPQKTYFAETALEFREILLPEVKLIRRRQSSRLLPLSSERDLNKNTCNWKQSVRFSGSCVSPFLSGKKDYTPIALRHMYTNYYL